VLAFRLLVLGAALVAIGAASRSSDRGAIRGRVLFVTPPVAAEHRPAIGDLGGARTTPIDRRQSVVYLESAPQPAFDEVKAGHFRMDQRDEQFVPRLLGVTVGTVVDFPNNDIQFHNVFSLSRAKSFDLGRYPPGRTGSVRFDRPGIVRVFCDIHSHMSAYILVFGHSYFALTDKDGRYIIPLVPAGSYNLMVWSELGQADQRRITVADNTIAEADFQIGRQQ